MLYQLRSDDGESRKNGEIEVEQGKGILLKMLD